MLHTVRYENFKFRPKKWASHWLLTKKKKICTPLCLKLPKLSSKIEIFQLLILFFNSVNTAKYSIILLFGKKPNQTRPKNKRQQTEIGAGPNSSLYSNLPHGAPDHHLSIWPSPDPYLTLISSFQLKKSCLVGVWACGWLARLILALGAKYKLNFPFYI